MTSLYEVLFIVPTNISEEDFSELSNKLRETIEKNILLKLQNLKNGLKGNWPTLSIIIPVVLTIFWKPNALQKQSKKSKLY